MRRLPGVYDAYEHELIHLIFLKKNDDGSFITDSLMQPTEQEIERKLREYNLPLEYTMRLIKNRDKMVHAIYFDLNEFEEHLRKEGYRL